MGSLSYARTSGTALDFKAADMMRDDLLHARARLAPNDVVVTHVWGPCPRCKDPIDVLQAFHPNGDEPAPDGAAPYPVDVACDCAAPWHGGASDMGGCGATFRLEVPFSDPSLF
ncbi:hypothetical protein F6X68_09910 [Micromonospora sp. AMSO12t]|uniref:hypothetical protein n=1 Tax=Micromonospora sp. AMSO12t TaxID=2650410 RepID=UPI00124B6E60|nr:hypothetical protein [Micromonospora sp. AMSO12t]KAB1159032.1 hypothetical protein F6X68_09910 [Micromonospora sp. AMSO12t]